MTRDERKIKALELVASGASLAAAGREVGVARNTVWYWLHPEVARADNAARHGDKLKWAHEHDRKRCPCGASIGIGVHRDPRHKGHCSACRLEMDAVRRAWRCQTIYEMWHEGFTLLGIALELGSTPGSINVSINRMRREGWDMPYRRQPRKATT